jgi:glycosyltransferase involved in cell wall biosynthesis
MRIAVDCRALSTPGGEFAGVGHYVRHLVTHLLRQDETHHWTLVFDDRAASPLVHEIMGSNPRVRAISVPLCRWKRALPYAYSHHLVASAFARSHADVTHFTSGSLPLGFRGRSVLTVHDLAIYTHPEWFPGGQFFSRRFVVPASLDRATRIIAVSEATKRDTVARFGTDPAKIDVVYGGVEHRPAPEGTADTLERHNLKRPYLLFLGTLEPRKNVESIVRAYAMLAQRFPKLVAGVDLVIAGGPGWKSDGLRQLIAETNRFFGASGPRIRTLGYVPAAFKPSLLSQALVFVFPSLYEGFGLPPLEAMSFGVPVVASNRGALVEVVGRAGILVDPLDIAELVLALKRLLEDPAKRAEWGAQALIRSQEFSWERAAGETLEVYNRTAAATQA